MAKLPPLQKLLGVEMQHLPEYLAMARPFSIAGTTSVERAIRRKFPVEVRIGTGPTPLIPARILGYCACTTDAIEILERALHRPVYVHLFSSAPKIATLAGGTLKLENCLPALAALVGGLRLAGFKGRLHVNVSRGSRELQGLLPNFPSPISSFLQRAAANNRNGADPIAYAVEHAGPSMYGDILELDDPDSVRVTVGGSTEAKFWAIRQYVIKQAAMNGLPVAASFGLIMRTVARPWYSPESHEPLLTDLITQGPERTIQSLKIACNPSCGGNAGLKREVRNTLRLINSGQAQHLVEVVSSVRHAASFLRSSDLSLGSRLTDLMMSLS